MAADGDIGAHESTYGRFLTALRYGAAAVFTIAAVVVILISR